MWTSLPGSYSGEATSDHDAIGGAVIAQSAETEVYIELFIIPGTSKQSAELVGTVPRVPLPGPGGGNPTKQRIDPKIS